MWSRPPGERLTLILPFWWLSPFALEVSGRVLAGDEQEPVHQDYHLILSRKTKAGLDQRNRNLVPHLGLKRSHHRFEPAFLICQAGLLSPTSRAMKTKGDRKCSVSENQSDQEGCGRFPRGPYGVLSRRFTSHTEAPLFRVPVDPPRGRSDVRPGTELKNRDSHVEMGRWSHRHE